jgi:hypothetical protein
MIPPWMIAVVLVFAVAATIWIWRALDEAAREAHKWAWYWAPPSPSPGHALFFFEGQSARLRIVSA